MWEATNRNLRACKLGWTVEGQKYECQDGGSNNMNDIFAFLNYYSFLKLNKPLKIVKKRQSVVIRPPPPASNQTKSIQPQDGVFSAPLLRQDCKMGWYNLFLFWGARSSSSKKDGQGEW